MVLAQPKASSIRFLTRWLALYPSCRVVRASMALRRRAIRPNALSIVAAAERAHHIVARGSWP